MAQSTDQNYPVTASAFIMPQPSPKLANYIPATYGNGKVIPKGYLESHSISNYGWIFDIKSSEPKGYVIPR